MNNAAPVLSCDTCGAHECPLHLEENSAKRFTGEEAWLLDRPSPEFDAYLNGLGVVSPQVFVPWPSAVLPLPTYTWPLAGAGRWTAAPLLTLRRSRAVRRLASRGGVLQRVMEEFDRKFAAAHAARLPYQVVRLVVAQNLVPFLHLDKTLGGREYDVLLGRAPRHVLHRELAEASCHYPESKTLRDFRSDELLVEAERTALENARRLITPQAKLARLYPGKTILLPWREPHPAGERPAGTAIGFLGPTLGRRGAYAVRAAFRQLGVPLVVMGRDLEGGDFWRGLAVEERRLDAGWLRGLGLLLAPVLTAGEPRRLLHALAHGIPVITTDACGLTPRPGLHFVDPYDAEALARKIEELHPERSAGLFAESRVP
jgi:hypothetical protein